MQLRATIGDVMCQFYIAEEKDPAMMVSFSNLSLSLLSNPFTFLLSTRISPVFLVLFLLFFFLLQLLSTRAKTLSILQKLQQVCEVGLSREPLYWLVYNALLLIYTLSRTMIRYDILISSVV